MRDFRKILMKRLQRLSGVLVVAILAIVTMVAVLLSFQNNGNISQMRAYELNKSLGKTHLDNFIFKKTPNDPSTASTTEDFENFKLTQVAFPTKVKDKIQELNLELALRFNRQHTNLKTIKDSEDILRDIAIQYFMDKSELNLFEKDNMTRAKKELLLSFNDALDTPIEGVYISNLKVRN